MTQYSITELAVLPGFTVSRATALNDSGYVIGSLRRRADDYFNTTPCIWKDKNPHIVGNDCVSLTAINNSSIVVGTNAKRRTHQQIPIRTAICYEDGKLKILFRPVQNCGVNDINDDGQIVGWISNTPNNKSPHTVNLAAFTWSSGKWEYLAMPSGYDQSKALAVNDHGQIVGTISASSNGHELAVLWSVQETILIEPPLGFNRSRAVDINNRGQVLVRALFSQDEVLKEMTDKIISGMYAKEAAFGYPENVLVMRQQSFLWDNGNWQTIDGLAESMNDQGQVVGWNGCDFSGSKMTSAKPYAFVWQNDNLVNLNTMIDADPGWTLTRANAINNRGQIVGNGTYNGQRRAFLLTPVVQTH